MVTPQPVDFQRHADTGDGQPVALLTKGDELPLSRRRRSYRTRLVHVLAPRYGFVLLANCSASAASLGERRPTGRDRRYRFRRPMQVGHQGGPLRPFQPLRRRHHCNRQARMMLQPQAELRHQRGAVLLL